MAGLCMTARATIRRCAIPPDSSRTAADARSASQNCSSSRAASAFASRALIPKNRPWKYRFSDTLSERSSVFVCGTTPMPCLARAGCAITSTPPTEASPSVGSTIEVSILVTT